MSPSSRRGAVLIIVLAVLAVLSLLAVAFAQVQALERTVSRNYLDAVRARLLARAGVDHALAELRALSRQNLISSSGTQPWLYWGDNTLEEGRDLVRVRLSVAMNPSFAVEEDGNPLSGSPAPCRVFIEGRPHGYSGVMDGGSQALHSDLYTLRVSDSSGRIFVNEGVGHHLGNDSTASRNLRRILNRLGAAIDPPVAELGSRIVANRPPGGYRILTELQSFLPDAEYDAVEGFLTTHAWLDHAVANPVPFSAAHAQAIKAEFDIEYFRGNPPVYRFGHGKDYLGTPLPEALQVYPATSSAFFKPDSLAHAIYAMDELNPQWIEIASRAPVNVNAAPREVLIALLADLRGVFVSERRRNNISDAGGYQFIKVKHTFSPANMPVPPERPFDYYDVPEGDESGFLYETYPIVGPGGTVSGIPASRIADEIIACREKKSSPSGIDYASVPFGGPFRSWRQFNEFCDNLVAAGILVDPRPIFYDHLPGPIALGNITGATRLTPSSFQGRVASQAIADVLKANFNPNLHLNELNPDRNLFLLVDKTDLVVNSTEFVFTPTGHYDVESIGRVLKPRNGNDSLAPDANNAVVAEAEIRAGLAVFDLVRETSQSQFSRGTCSPRTAGYPTNNNRSLEAGPEPDNGGGPLENRWSGYLALPTVGGNFAQTGPTKEAGALMSTPAAQSEMGETIHTHLSWDFDAHHHLDGIRRDLGSAAIAGESVRNYPDPDSAAPGVAGPYDPTDNGGNYYRLAHDFELPPPSRSATRALPALARRAPLDLRIDGGYLERHSGLAYWISRSSYVPSTRAKAGVLSYWLKPNFFPERSGKPRLFADMTRVSRPYYWGYKDAQFMCIWNPAHNTLPGVAPLNEYASRWSEPGGADVGVVPFKPQVMLFGVGYGSASGVPDVTVGPDTLYVQWMQTASLTHEGHGHTGTSYLKAHEWTHVLLVWSRTRSVQWQSDNVPSNPTLDYKIVIDGQVLPGHLAGQYCPRGFSDGYVDWTVHQNGERNSLRFGAVSAVTGEGPTFVNFGADSTLDEIFFWNSQGYEDRAQQQWLAGRYSYPKSSDEGVFTSQEIATSGPKDRVLAPPSTTPPPEDVLPKSSFEASIRPAEVLGISWTFFAEGSGADPEGRWVPTLTDHASGGPLFPTIEASLPGMTPTNVKDEGYSPFTDAQGCTPRVTPGSPFRYRLTLRIPGTAWPSTILLATPVVDDITLFVDNVETPFLYYYHVSD